MCPQDLFSPLGIVVVGAHTVEGLLQSWGGDWGVGFGGKDGEQRTEDCLPASLTELGLRLGIDWRGVEEREWGFRITYLPSLAGGWWVPKECLGSWQLRQRAEVVRKAVSEVLLDPLQMWA